MKGLSTDREDNIFFHMFSLQKKNLIQTGKSKQKQKNKHYGFFFISHCHPVRSPVPPGKGKFQKSKKKKLPQTNLPRQKKQDPKYHQTSLPPKNTLLLLTLFLGGIGKNHASQRLLQLTFSRNPTS